MIWRPALDLGSTPFRHGPSYWPREPDDVMVKSALLNLWRRCVVASILVLGATGTVGRLVLKGLTDRGLNVTGASRDPLNAATRAGVVAPFVEFDYDRATTFTTALKDISKVFMTVRPGDNQSDVTALPLLEAMSRHKVEHVVLLSAMGAELREDFALRKIERAIEKSGMSYTFLRPNWFMQVFAAGSLLQGITAKSAIALPAGQARISYIDGRDVADVAVECLTNALHQRRSYTLTGPQSLDHDDIAAILTRVCGRPIRYIALEEDDARLRLREAGFPEEWVERLIGFYRLVRKEWCAPVVQEMPALLQHAPRTFDDFAAEHSSLWRVVAAPRESVEG